MTDSKQESLIDYRPHTPTAIAARFSRMSYTDLFALALRYGTGGGPPGLKPSQARQFSLARENQHPLRKNILYLHVPFCQSRCRYCPYYSHHHTPALMSAYLDALAREVAMVSQTPYVRSTKFWCLYFGGGTPSLLSPDGLERLSVLLHRNFNFTADVEMTFEANPSSLTEEKIRLLRPLGFNRVSLGVQSFHDPLLRKMGCAHSAAQARRTIELVLDQGLMLNVDLLFGLPGQTQAGVASELGQLCNDAIPHQVTMFPVRIAKATPLADDLHRQGPLDVMTHNRRLLKLDALVERHLRKHSFMRAEVPISYYREEARPHRYQSVEGRILGLGPGAGSILEGAESVNHRDVARYVGDLRENRLPVAHDGHFTREQARERYVLFRILFMNRSLASFREIVEKHFREYYDEPIGSYYENVLDDMKRRAYVELVGSKVVFTERLWSMLAGLDIGTPSIL